MNYRKKTAYFLLIVCSLVHLSMAEFSPIDPYGILDTEDYALVGRQARPALSSVAGDVPEWASYNRWLCFPITSVETDCRDSESDQSWNSIDPDERDGNGYYAVMDIDYEGRQYRFESPGWVSLDKCLSEIERKRGLIKGQVGFCTFAAELPTEVEPGQQADDGASVWVSYGFKTFSGQLMAPIYDSNNIEEKNYEKETFE